MKWKNKLLKKHNSGIRFMAKDLFDKINISLDKLQDMMEAQEHIKNPYKVLNQIAVVSSYWDNLNDDERDFCDNAKYFTEAKLEWTV